MLLHARTRVCVRAPVVHRCGRCHHPIKKLSNNVLSLCMINLGHYVRYDPCSAVPLLPRILEQVRGLKMGVTGRRWCEMGLKSLVLV